MEELILNTTTAIFDPTKWEPIFCFGDMIEKNPMSLTYCFIYVLSVLLMISLGIYYYYKRMTRRSRNGYTNNQQDSGQQPSDIQVLRRLLRSGSSTSSREEIPLFNGPKP